MWAPAPGQEKISYLCPWLLVQGRAHDHSQANEKPPEDFLPEVLGDRQSLLGWSLECWRAHHCEQSVRENLSRNNSSGQQKRREANQPIPFFAHTSLSWACIICNLKSSILPRNECWTEALDLNMCLYILYKLEHSGLGAPRPYPSYLSTRIRPSETSSFSRKKLVGL